MAMVRDLTPKFREAVRATAVANGYDEVIERAGRLIEVFVVSLIRIPFSNLILQLCSPRRLVSDRKATEACEVGSSYVISHATYDPSPFGIYLTATHIAASVRDLQTFVARHGRDYAEKHRSTEQDRDSIENEVGLFVKACRDSIEALKNSIGREEKQADGANWLQALGRGSPNTDCIAHQHGVVEDFDQLRSIRFEETVNKKMHKRRKGLEHLLPPENIPVSVPDNDGYSKDWLKEEEPRLLESRQQSMDQETEALQQELTEMMAMTQETERKMIELSALNYLFSTHVLRQAQQIETLYMRAMEATNFMDKGNNELTKTQQRNSSSRLYIILIFCVLTTTLLFLDWYNG